MRSAGALYSLYGLHSLGSLALEVVFFKAASLAFGFDLPAAGTVLFVYLLGTAVGAVTAPWLRRRFSTRRLFLVSQAFLCLLAVSAPQLFGLAERGYVAAASGVDGLPLHVLRVAFVAAAMAPVAFVSGIVFPSLAREAKWLDRGTLFGLSRLYVLGTIASALGAWLAAVVLLPEVGTYSSMTWLGVLYGAIALAGIWMTAPSDEPGGQHASLPGPSRTGGVAFLLGASLFAAEVAWFQLLWQAIDPTPYVTGTVLAVLLLAMGLGAAAPRARTSLSVSLLVASVGTLVALAYGSQTARWLTTVLLPGASFARYLLTAAACAAGVCLIGAAGHGASIAALLTEGRRNTGATETASTVSAFHALGGAVGALAASFVLVASIGASGTMAVSTLCLAIALVVQRSRPVLVAVGLTVACFAGILAYRSPSSTQGPSGQRVVFHREDGTGVTKVIEDARGRRALVSNRLRQEGGDAPEQAFLERLQGYLPLLAHPRPTRVLVVGLGTGISLSPFASAPEVTALTCVEISPAIVEAAGYFEEANEGVLDNAKLRLVVDDGRGLLKRDQARYDLIVQELFFPYASGGSSLYTREHYEQVRARLLPQGLTVQWLSLAQLGFRELRILIATFREVFPETHLFLAGGYLGLFGSDAPLRFDLDRWNELTQGTALRRDLSFGPVETAEDLLGFYLDGPRAAARLSDAAEVQTDDHLHVEYGASRLVGRLNTTALTSENLAAIRKHLGFDLPELTGGTEAQRARAEAVLASRRPLVDAILARAGDDLDAAREAYAEVFRLHPKQPQARRFVLSDALAEAAVALDSRNLDGAAHHFARALRADPRNVEARLGHGILRATQGRLADAVTTFVLLLEEHPKLVAARYQLGLSLYELGEFPRAALALEGVVAQQPAAIDARFHLGNALTRLGRLDDARNQYRTVLSIRPAHEGAKANLAAVLALNNHAVMRSSTH